MIHVCWVGSIPLFFLLGAGLALLFASASLHGWQVSGGTCRGDSGLSFAVALVRGCVTVGVVEGVTGIQVMRIHVDQPLQ